MQVGMAGNGAVWAECGCYHQPDFPLLQYIGGRCPVACLQTAIRRQTKAKSRLVIVSRLFRIAHIKFDMVNIQNRKKVVAHGILH
jgi:hypothetical protein